MRHLFAPLSLALLLTACGQGEPLTPPNAVLPDGGRYRGEIVDGLLQGQGRVDYRNGSWYAGDFKDGQADGHGEWQGSNGERYVGEFRQGLFHGQGELSDADGNRYQGQFKHGRRHGEGQLQQGPLSYRGGFKADRYHGFGTLELPDGSRYQGAFKQGEPSGQGTRSDAEGERFTGEFVHGLLNGQGSYSGSDGASYSGAFRDNQFHGQGRYESAEGEVWVGTFKQGALTGPGEFHGGDQRHYQGQFSHWRFAGQGRLSLADGSVYEGQFARDLYHGPGRLTLADGRVQAGEWQYGERRRDEHQKAISAPLELGLLAQGSLLEQALAAVPASTPAIELYSLTVAGDGQQSVFLREADFANQLLSQRFGARGQISLINHRDHLQDRPLATRENLSRAVQTLAQRSGPEDLIFIYLTSHGSSSHELSLVQPRLELNDLPASALAEVLKPLQQRHKVVVVSACYSGGFIPPLKDAKTLVISAARADRVSFGCSEDADFTYFGRAFLSDALNETDDLQQAFELTKKHIAAREKAEDFQPSEPQIWAPKAVLSQWHKMRKQQAEQALSAASTDKPRASH